MRKLLFLWCGLLAAGTLGVAGRPLAAPSTEFVGPTQILFVDADSVYFLRSLEWHSAAARHQEKLLLHGLRMKYWRDHLPADMRQVYDELGYPTGRVLHTPVGHTEEWWYYGQLNPPLRFRDGDLVDADLFESMVSRFRAGR